MTEPATVDLTQHRRALAGTTLAQLFARDADRFAQLSFTWDDWPVDVSKERLARAGRTAARPRASRAGG